MNCLSVPQPSWRFYQLFIPSKNNKSHGYDKYLLSREGNHFTRTVNRYITKVWAVENIPQNWGDVNIVTMYENMVDKATCGNSSGISLFSVSGKVLGDRRTTGVWLLPCT